FVVAATNCSTNGSYMLRSTITLLRAQQSWPVLAKTLMGEVPAARRQSASAKTMLGDLPPSSSEMRFRPRDASSMMRRPISVEPVKEIFRINGCVTSASPMAEPLPGNTWSTPGGSPAAWASSPSLSAVSGESDAGLSTTQLPAASAGAAFQQAIGNGKFHGTIAATTPIGWRKVKSKPPRPTGMVLPQNLVTAPA